MKHNGGPSYPSSDRRAPKEVCHAHANHIPKGDAMQIKKAKLTKILRVLGAAVPKKPTLEVLANVRLGGGLAMATDLEKQIVVQVPELVGVPILVPHRLFAELLRSLPDGDLDITQMDDGRVLVHVGDREVSMECPHMYRDFPPVKEGDFQQMVKVDGDYFTQALAETAVCAASRDDRPVLNGVCLEVGEDATLVGADGFRLAVMRLGVPMPLMTAPLVFLGPPPPPDEPEPESGVSTHPCGCTVDMNGRVLERCTSEHCSVPEDEEAEREPGDPDDPEKIPEGDQPAPIAPVFDARRLVIPIITVRALGKLWKALDIAGGDDPNTLQSRRLMIQYGPGCINFHIPARSGGEDMRVDLTSRTIDGTFPNYASLISASTGRGVVFRAEEMAGKVAFLAPIAEQGSGIIRLVWAAASIQLTAHAAETGSAGTHVRAACRGTGKIAFNSKYLREYFKGRVGTVLLEYNGEQSPGVFTHDGHPLVVLMPMFVAWDSEPEGAKSPLEEAAPAAP